MALDDPCSTGVSTLMNLTSWPLGHSLVEDTAEVGLEEGRLTTGRLTTGLGLSDELPTFALVLLSDLSTDQ